MGSFGRATTFFVVLLALITGFGIAMRDLLHLDCVGPVLPAWGCLAVPFPTSVDEATISSGDFLRWVLAAIVLYVACFILRDALAHASAAILRRFFPRLLRPPANPAGPPQRGYRYR